MANSIKETMTNAHLKVGIRAAIEHKLQELQALISEHVVEFSNHITDIESDAAAAPSDPRPIGNAACSAMDVVAAHTKAGIESGAAETRAARKHLKMFVFEHNITFKPLNPNILMSCLVFTSLAGIEGITTATFFLNGGYVASIAEALALGLMISCINIVLAGLLGGGFFGKFWNFGLNMREDSLAVRSKRLAGRICSILVILAIAFVLLVSGIVRATGEPEHLSYSFASLSSAASDFHSILLWVLGAAFAILSWRKGLSAFSSPYPGLSDASNAATQSEAEVKSLYDGGLEEVQDIYDDAVEDLEDMANDIADQRQELIDDLQDAQHHREDVLAAISDAESGFSVFQAEQVSIYDALSEGTEPPDLIAFDGAAWRAKLPTIAIDISSHSSGFAAGLAKERAELSRAREAAIQRINEAYQQTLS